MKRLLLALLPVTGILPIFYVQGMASHEGYLSAAGIPPGLYPLDLEQILVNAYMVYVIDIESLFLLGVAFSFVLPAVGWVAHQMFGASENARWLAILAKPVDKTLAFFSRHAALMAPGIVLISAVYLLALSTLLIVWPYNQSQERSRERLHKGMENLRASHESPCETQVNGFVTFVTENPLESFCGFVVVSSPTMLSVLVGREVRTFRLNKIRAIHSSVNNS